MMMHQHHPTDFVVGHMLFSLMNVDKEEVYQFQGEQKTLYTIVYRAVHYIVLQVDFDQKRILVYDGQVGDLASWQEVAIKLLKLCGMVDLKTRISSVGMMKTRSCFWMVM